MRVCMHACVYMCVCVCVYFYYNPLLLIKVGTIFNRCDSALLFVVQLGMSGFNLHFAHFLGCNQRTEHPGVNAWIGHIIQPI